jgi:hydrogenase maturation protease
MITGAEVLEIGPGMNTSKRSVLIIGFGNVLRCDDGAGVRAAERLALPGIEILPVQQLTPELMLAIARARRVIFIDAARDGRPGEVRRREVEPEVSGVLTHVTTPEALLAGATMLYESRATGVLYSVTGESFELSDRLSPVVESAMAELVAAIEDEAVRSVEREFES